MKSLGRIVAIAAGLVACLWLGKAMPSAQGARPRCQPVQARNAQEALMMEAASHREGCWTRDASGQLVFINHDETPKTTYKPPVSPAEPRRPQWPMPPPPGGRCQAAAQKMQTLAVQARHACIDDPLYGPNGVGFEPGPGCLAADNRAAAALAPYCSCLGFRPNPAPEPRDVGAFYPSVTGGMRQRRLPRPANAYPSLCTEDGDWIPKPQAAVTPSELTAGQIRAAIARGLRGGTDTEGRHLTDTGSR
jgi:hypothetical protein